MNLAFARKVAVAAVKDAGKILIDGLDAPKGDFFKQKGEIVTKVDLAAEKAILSRIKKSFPEHSILSEERGFYDRKSGYIWVVDPVDGTMNYFHGVAPVLSCICLLKKDKPLVSAMYDPLNRELFVAVRNEGATVNSRKMRVSKISDFKHAVIATRSPHAPTIRQKTLAAIQKITKKEQPHFRMIGSVLASMAYVAKGNFDCFFNLQTTPWDVLPAVLLVEEAGGKVTDFNGKRIGLKSTSALASNGVLHAGLLRLLKSL